VSPRPALASANGKSKAVSGTKCIWKPVRASGGPRRGAAAGGAAGGAAAATAGGYTTDYEEVPLSGVGRAALKPGKNVIAVHCHQTGGGQYIDVGLVEVQAGK